MLDAPIRDYIARLRDRRRVIPTDRRKRAGYRIAGSWSVQLQPGGFHINHVHPQGWLSSAYYVELPESRDGHSARGLAQVRRARRARSPVCAPDHFVEPGGGNAGAVPVVPVARHRAIQRRRPPADGRLRRGALPNYLARLRAADATAVGAELVRDTRRYSLLPCCSVAELRALLGGQREFL